MEHRAIKLANRMNYVVGDIHNDACRFKSLLKRIEFGENDHLFLLGDLFDRCGYDPDPVCVYFTVRAIKSQCSIVTGNHDRLLAEYIKKYYGTKERKRKRLPDYPYNSFEILRSRLTQVDMIALDLFCGAGGLSCGFERAGFRILLGIDNDAIISLVPDGGNYPVLKIGDRYRRFTPREVARIQSFPENYKLSGTDAAQYRALGNAIPPVMFWYIINALIEIIEKNG